MDVVAEMLDLGMALAQLPGDALGRGVPSQSSRISRPDAETRTPRSGSTASRWPGRSASSRSITWGAMRGFAVRDLHRFEEPPEDLALAVECIETALLFFARRACSTTKASP